MTDNKNKIILGLVSEMGGGKGEASRYLKENHNAFTFRYSDIIRDVLNVLSLPHLRENMQSIATGLRKIFGEDVFCNAMLKRIKACNNNLIVIDGIRKSGDLEGLRDLDNFYLIAIDAPTELRFKRIVERGENPDDKTKTWDEFQKQLEAETETSIREVIKEAKFNIDNTGDLENFHRKLDELIESFG